MLKFLNTTKSKQAVTHFQLFLFFYKGLPRKASGGNMSWAQTWVDMDHVHIFLSLADHHELGTNARHKRPCRWPRKEERKNKDNVLASKHVIFN